MKKENKVKYIKTVFILITLISISYAIINGFFVIQGGFRSDDCRWIWKDGHIEIRGVTNGGVADSAGLKDGDILLKINNKSFVDGNDAQEYINKVDDIRTIYTVLRNNTELKLSVVLRDRTIVVPIIMYMAAFVFLFVGFTIIMNNPLHRISHIYYYLSYFFFLFLAFHSTGQTVEPFARISIYIKFVTNALLPPIVFHFFTVFPKRVFFFRKSPKLIWLFYIPSVTYMALTELRLVSSGRYNTISFVIYFILSLILLIFNYIRTEKGGDRKPLKIILFGTVFGLGTLISLLLFQSPLMEHLGLWIVSAALAAMSLLPLSFGYAVMKYSLMDAGIVIKKSIVYSLTTGIFISLYLILTLSIGDYFTYALGIERRIFYPLIIIIIGFSFHPVRLRIQELMDRKFNKKQYNYERTLLQLSKDIQTQIDLESMAENLSSKLKTILQTEFMAIMIEDNNHNYKPISGRKIFDGKFENLLCGPSSSIRKYLSNSCSHLDLNMAENMVDDNSIREDEIKKLRECGLTLIIPICRGNHLSGFLIFGNKISGDHYSSVDINLLNTIASQAAIAIENGKMHKNALKHQKIEEEIKIAKSIQEDLLPREAPNMKGLEISGISIPAREVGGDYFDYIRKDIDKLLIFVGDVSGKGIAASLYMSKVQGMIQIAGSFFNSPKRILTEVNKKIIEKIEKRSFITMLAILIDTKTGLATMSRAGHNSLIVKNRDKNEAGIFKPSGIGLGIVDGDSFASKLEEMKIPFKKGDFFVLYSDGLTEAMNRENRMFGEESVLSIINNGKYSNPEELRDLLLKKVRKFRNGAEQNDDITLVIVKII